MNSKGPYVSAWKPFQKMSDFVTWQSWTRDESAWSIEPLLEYIALTLIYIEPVKITISIKSKKAKQGNIPDSIWIRKEGIINIIHIFTNVFFSCSVIWEIRAMLCSFSFICISKRIKRADSLKSKTRIITCSWHQKTKARILQFTNLKCCIMAREAFKPLF